MHPFKSFLFALVVLACITGAVLLLPNAQWAKSLREQFPLESLSTSQDDSFEENREDSLSLQQVSDITTDLDKSVSDTLSWYDLLDNLLHKDGQIRIMYYGDSQIEGDRITSNMRKYLRQYMGGTGPGLFLPVMPVMYTKSLLLQSSSNWKRYNYLSYRDKNISYNELGPFMAICRYLPEGVRSDSPVKATVKVHPSNVADSASSYFDRLRLFYGNCDEDVILNISSGNTLIVSDTLIKGEGVNEMSCYLNGAKQLTLEFVGNVSPDIYGISIESDEGVVLDNIPQRGSTGLEFTMIDEENLKESYDYLNPDLIVLQYGLNVVVNVRKEYGYYKRGVSRQIERLKSVTDNVPILVLGVTDMANDTGGVYTNIPAIIDAQKSAAYESGAYFWNAYSLMGGQGSIFEWQKNHLVQADGVHMTDRGVNTLAQMLIDDLFNADSIKNIVSSDIISEPVEPDVMVAEMQDDDIKPLDMDAISPKKGNTLLLYDEEHPLIFTSILFWCFLCLFLLGFGLVFKHKRLRNIYLLVVSLYIYYKTGGAFVLLLICVILINYICGLLIGHSKRKGKRGTAALIVGIVVNVSVLFYCKYSQFLIDSINSLFGTSFVVYDYLAAFANAFTLSHFDVDTIILPVGISFFIFQALSYIIDVWRNDVAPERNIADFGFYLSFFPQLVAGPIVRASEFMPQVSAPYNLTKREFGHALFLICKGLVKKIVIADCIANLFVDNVFGSPTAFSGFENLMAVYGYALQIYCDFSGYTDIAIGLALLFGFKIPVNFNSPYKAINLTDFWRRWHISLSRWLKDYLYIPLGGNRKGSFRTNLNIMITMLIGGLWHGASIRFVVWGGLHGIGLVLDKLISPFRGKNAKKLFVKNVAILLTFHFVAFCWIFFRSDSLEMATVMIGQIFHSFSPGSYADMLIAYKQFFVLLLAGYLIHFIPENAKEWSRGLFISMPIILKIAVVLAVVVLLCAVHSSTPTPFIYFRF